jgi:O-antigen/teichoic acid export membrane protein
MTVRAILGVVALTLGVYLTHSLLCGAVCILVSSTLVLVAYDVPKALSIAQINFRKLRKEFGEYCRDVVFRNGHRRLWKLVMTGLPMGFIMMLVSLNLNIPRYFIQQQLGTQALAIFSAIATLVTAGNVFTNAIGQAAAPRLAKSFANCDWRAFGFMLGALLAVSLGLGFLCFAGAFLFGKQAMAILYRPEYTTRQDVLLWLMGGSGFLYLGSTLGYAVTAVRCFTPQLPLCATAALATAIGCVALVPSQGLRGVAMAILISAVVQCAGNAGLLWNACKRGAAECCAAA